MTIERPLDQVEDEAVDAIRRAFDPDEGIMLGSQEIRAALAALQADGWTLTRTDPDGLRTS